MKRSPLKRKQGLTLKTCLSKISPKQEIEIAKRRLLKWQLYQEQKGICPVCGRYMNYRVRTAANYPELSHKKHIGMGGCKDKSVTTKENCSVICAECHSNGEHHLRNKYKEESC